MLDKSQDSYFTTFGTYEEMLDYHEEQAKSSIWHRCPVNRLEVFVRDLKVKEIAKMLNCSPNFVSDQKRRALEALRRKLDEGGDENG